MKAYPTSTVDDPRPHQQTQVADERSIRKVKPRHKSSAEQLHFSVGRGPSEILWIDRVLKLKETRFRGLVGRALGTSPPRTFGSEFDSRHWPTGKIFLPLYHSLTDANEVVLGPEIKATLTLRDISFNFN